MGNLDNYSDIPYNVDFSLLDSFLYNASRFASSILGLIAVLIATYTTVITVFDILYLSYPVFQSFVLDRNLGISKDKKLKFSIISRDAQLAVEEKYRLDTTSNKYNNTLLIYLVKRSITYLRFGIIFFILAVGPSQILKALRFMFNFLFEVFN